MKKWLPEELEEIPCDFCGARETAKQFIRKDGMRVVECAQCGLAYLNPRPKPEFITRFYDPDYFTGAAAERRSTPGVGGELRTGAIDEREKIGEGSAGPGRELRLHIGKAHGAID